MNVSKNKRKWGEPVQYKKLEKKKKLICFACLDPIFVGQIYRVDEIFRDIVHEGCIKTRRKTPTRRVPPQRNSSETREQYHFRVEAFSSLFCHSCELYRQSPICVDCIGIAKEISFIENAIFPCQCESPAEFIRNWPESALGRPRYMRAMKALNNQRQGSKKRECADG